MTTGNNLADFSIAAADLVNGADGSTAYTYDDRGTGVVLPGGAEAETPFVSLAGPDPYSFTDCNGWVNYALGSVAPVHQAVLAAARLQPYYNQGSLNGHARDGKAQSRNIREAGEPMPRAYVMQGMFAATPPVGQASANGFARVDDLSALRPGDILAYTLGRYADLSDPELPWPTDTGHVMIVTQARAVALSDLSAAEQAKWQAAGVVQVVAVSVVDSSSVPHLSGGSGIAADQRLDPDDTAEPTYIAPDLDRARQAGVPVHPATRQHSGSPEAGGLGTGTIYVGRGADGTWQRFQFNENDPVQPGTGTIGIAAARLSPVIDLGQVAATDGRLEVTLMPNRTDTLGGTSYAEPEQLVGTGGLLVDGSGSLTLSGANTFSGGVELHGVTLSIGAVGAAGSGAITTDAGTANRIDLAAGPAAMRLAGNDTVAAAQGGATVTGAGGQLHFVGSGASTVSGGTGSATISGGAGGLYVGGTAGRNVIEGGGRSTLWGGGDGDTIRGGAGDVLGAAATGNATLLGGGGGMMVDAGGTTAFAGTGDTVFGAGRGTDTVVAGPGAGVFVGGAGTSDLFQGAGDLQAWAGTGVLCDVAGPDSGSGTLVLGGGRAELWISAGAGAQHVLDGGTGGGSAVVVGFRPGIDRFDGGAAVTGQQVSAGSLVLTLADRTQVSFLGVSSLG